jgi:hypothetical protein
MTFEMSTFIILMINYEDSLLINYYKIPEFDFLVNKLGTLFLGDTFGCGASSPPTAAIFLNDCISSFDGMLNTVW